MCVTVDGRAPFRTRINIDGGVGWIGFRKAMLAEFGLSIGDRITIRLELDDQPREVEVPAELVAAFSSNPDAEATYQALSFTHRKEYARWVASGVKSETRENRAGKAVTMLRDGVKTPD